MTEDAHKTERRRQYEILKKEFDPGVRKCSTMTIAVLVLLPVLYVLSFGPVMWFFGRKGDNDAVVLFYYPLFCLAWNGPGWLAKPLVWYAGWGA